MCFAISDTDDPTGLFTRYSITAPPDPDGQRRTMIPDSPKWGVWHSRPSTFGNSSSYLLTTRNFGGGPIGKEYLGVTVYVIEKEPLLREAVPRVFRWNLSSARYGNRLGDVMNILPPDIDGRSLPSYTTLIPFASSQDTSFNAPFDAINMWSMQVNWRSSALPVLYEPVQLRAAPFDGNGCSGGVLDCRDEVPLPLGQRVDSWPALQPRLAYRNFGSFESLVTTRDVQVFVPGFGLVLRPRWFEIRRVGTRFTYFIRQQSTYSPADGVYRWTGSMAQDKLGNMIIGYSAASETVFPGIRYAGRRRTDLLNRLTFGFILIGGTGTQTGTARWGTHASMTIDPDDCTFWFTAMYYERAQNGNVDRGGFWSTRIGSFIFPECQPSFSDPEVDELPDDEEKDGMNLRRGLMFNNTIG
jgi:hypothetical protein